MSRRNRSHMLDPDLKAGVQRSWRPNRSSKDPRLLEDEGNSRGSPCFPAPPLAAPAAAPALPPSSSAGRSFPDWPAPPPQTTPVRSRILLTTPVLQAQGRKGACPYLLAVRGRVRTALQLPQLLQLRAQGRHLGFALETLLGQSGLRCFLLCLITDTESSCNRSNAGKLQRSLESII